MIVVDLIWREVILAGNVAILRSVENFIESRKDAHALEYDNLGVDIHWQGAIAELAVAKFLGCYWNPLEIGIVDVGGCEVRSVGRDSKRLIIHKKDRDRVPFISALVERKKLPHVTLRGWMLGMDGKQDEWWADPKGGRPAFFVPNEKLLPMENLRGIK